MYCVQKFTTSSYLGRFYYTATSLAPKYAPGRHDSLPKYNRDSLSRDKQQTADMSGGHFQIQTFKAIDEMLQITFVNKNDKKIL